MDGIAAIVSLILIVIGIILVAVCLWKCYYFKHKPNDGMTQFFNHSRSSSISSARKPSVQLVSRSRSPHTLEAIPNANGNHPLKAVPLLPPEPGFTVTVVSDDPHSANISHQPNSPPPEKYPHLNDFTGFILPPKVEEEQSEPLPLTDVCSDPPMAEPPIGLNDSIILPDPNAALIEPLHPTRTKSYLPESVVLINKGMPPYPLATASRPRMAVFYRPAQGLPPPTYSQAMHGRYSPIAPEVNKEEYTEFQSYR